MYRMSCLEERLPGSEAGQQSWKAQDGRYNVFFGTVTRSNERLDILDVFLSFSIYELY